MLSHCGIAPVVHKYFKAGFEEIRYQFNHKLVTKMSLEHVLSAGLGFPRQFKPFEERFWVLENAYPDVHCYKIKWLWIICLTLFAVWHFGIAYFFCLKITTYKLFKDGSSGNSIWICLLCKRKQANNARENNICW